MVLKVTLSTSHGHLQIYSYGHPSKSMFEHFLRLPSSIPAAARVFIPSFLHSTIHDHNNKDDKDDKEDNNNDGISAPALDRDLRFS